MDDAQQIAAKLTKAGREALDWVRPNSIMAPFREGAREIESLGLVKREEGVWFVITDLGRAVRAWIEGKEL